MAYVADSPKSEFRRHTTNSKVCLDSLEQILKTECGPALVHATSSNVISKMQFSRYLYWSVVLQTILIYRTWPIGYDSEISTNQLR